MIQFESPVAEGQPSTVREVDAFANASGYEYRVILDGAELQLWHRPPVRFRASKRGDRWDSGVTVTISPDMLLTDELRDRAVDIGVTAMRMYMLRAITFTQFEEYRRVLEVG